MLCEEERIILDYLKANEEVFISPATISRRACPKRFRDKPTWAYPFLTRMFDARIIECDPATTASWTTSASVGK